MPPKLDSPTGDTRVISQLVTIQNSEVAVEPSRYLTDAILL